MIQIPEFPTKTFSTIQEAHQCLKENKDMLILAKKKSFKKADAVSYAIETSLIIKDNANKSEENAVEQDPNKLKIKLVINTTNLLDSHMDVHLKGIWKKSINELKSTLLLQEHKMTFENIITDDVKVYTKKANWKDLGFNFEKDTECLIFEAIISKDRNPFMFEQYKNGYVKEHSVGMQYVKYYLAINSDYEDDKEEKEVWDKYISEIANPEQAIERGYFWAITEAKIMEGSAVVKGSNFATPTLSVEAVKNTPTDESEPLPNTQTPKEEPQEQFIDLNFY